VVGHGCHQQPGRRTGPVGRLWSPREIEADGGPKHTKLYLLLAANELEAVKLGSKTKITGRSYDAYKANLPRLITARSDAA
jgi:hypothetical protein